MRVFNGGAIAPAQVFVLLFSAALPGLATLQTTDIREQLVQQGADPVGNTPEQFAAIIKADISKWATVIKVSGATPD